MHSNPRATIEKAVNDSIPSDTEEQSEYVIIEQRNNAKDKIIGMAKQKLCRNGQVNGFMISVKSVAKEAFLMWVYISTGQGLATLVCLFKICMKRVSSRVRSEQG